MAKIYYPQARAFLTVTIDDFTNRDPREKYRQSLWLVPETVTVVKNPTTQADSFTLTFAVEDFPFLPSQIVGGQAEIYLFQTDGVNQAEMSLSRDAVLPLAGPPPAAEGTTVDINDVRLSSNWPVVVGTFDDVSAEYADGGRTITISGQDYTSYLLGRQWPPNAKGGPRRVKKGPRLDIWLRDVINEADPDLKLQIAVSGVQLKDIPEVGSGFAIKKNGIAIDQGTKYWDVITKVCWLHGFSVYIEGTFVVLLARKGPAEGKTPLIYTLSWKENIAALKTSRKLGKEKAPQVIIQSYDPKTKKTITGEYPPGADIRRRSKKRDTEQDVRTTVTTPGKAKAKSKPRAVTDKSSEEYEVLPAGEAISDVATLNRMAKDRYELTARGQFKMTVQTSDLRDTMKNGKSNDLLKMRSGDVMIVEFDPFDLEQLNRLDNGDSYKITEKFDFLRGQGYSADLSRLIAAQYNTIDQLRRPFIVSEVQFDYSVDDGIDIEVQLVEAINADVEDDATTEDKRKTKQPAVKTPPRDLKNTFGL